jgi:hypothetical protein
MRHPLGLYLVTVAFVLTWPLHIGAATFALAEMVGEYFAPHKDHVLFWFASLPIGGLLTLLLIIGVFMRQRVAFYVSAFVLLGGLWTLSRFAVRDAYDWLIEIALALLLVLSALYLIWRSRHLRIFSHEKPVAS